MCDCSCAESSLRTCIDHADMAQKADVAEYREKLAQIDSLIEYAMSGTARVIMQREGL